MDLDDDSGSAYEEPSGSERSVSHDEKIRAPRGRSRSASRIRKAKAPRSPESEVEVEKDPVEWALEFEEPKSTDDVPSPRRRPNGPRKRRLELSPSELRTKRVRGKYSREYRDLLNIDIHDAAARTIHEDHYPLPGSQIGSSVWTSLEKDRFFSALDRLGRDDIRGICDHIETKSEPEVHEYLQLLHQATVNKKSLKKAQILELIDLPAATQISDELYAQLEGTADNLTARQERAEERIEKGKWGDIWLITEHVCHQLEKRRKEDEEAIEEVIPAVNLLNIRNWLELSSRVFMNPSFPKEDNWEAIAVQGETPAIRATAFEDFHSLAVSITKRLISTTLFCTMSRLRARGANKIKHAEVNPNDVEAAVAILGMKANSDKFWTKCARICNLSVVNDDNIGDELLSGHSRAVPMTYDEVEAALGTTSRSRSRSRSLSRQASPRTAFNPDNQTSSGSDLDDFESDIDSLHNSEANSIRGPGRDEHDSADLSLSDSSIMRPSSKQSLTPSTPKALQASHHAQEAYAEALDTQASQLEESRLWTLLNQTPPFEIKLEPIDEERPNPVRQEVDTQENWRDYLEFRNQWEVLDTPVPEDAFERNRRRKSRRARKERGDRTTNARSVEGEDGALSDERDDSDGNSSSSDNEEERDDGQDERDSEMAIRIKNE
jgi:RNA polymerase I-specific transcription initiation factor RRN5